MPFRFSDKTVVITGASSGVGAAAANQFAAEGARIVLAARRKDALEARVRDIGPRQALAVPTDVTRVEAAAALLEAAQRHFGSVDILVNNAGYHARGRIKEVPVDEVGQMVDVNLRAPATLSRLALPYLGRNGGGAIVNVASIAGRVPVAGGATYCATKFGLRAFSLALAEELAGTGITVSVVSPGPVDTNFFRNDAEKSPDMFFSSPILSADRVARLILMCAHDGKRERTIPWASGHLATMGYVCPGMKRLLEPALKLIGRSRKRRFIARRARA
jgi:hypothetical protein